MKGCHVFCILCVLRMGVDHGGDAGDKSTPEFGVGEANANCPPQIFVI